MNQQDKNSYPLGAKARIWRRRAARLKVVPFPSSARYSIFSAASEVEPVQKQYMYRF